MKDEELDKEFGKLVKVLNEKSTPEEWQTVGRVMADHILDGMGVTSHRSKANMDLKEQVKGRVRFEFYRDGALYYKTEAGLLFPVPIEDIGSATFLAEDKALLFMRYIRKQIALIKDGHVAQLDSERQNTNLEVGGSIPSVSTTFGCPNCGIECSAGQGRCHHCEQEF